jgi:hypothetical protein
MTRPRKSRRTRDAIRAFLRAAEQVCQAEIDAGYGPPGIRRVYYLMRGAQLGGVTEDDKRFVKDRLIDARKLWLASDRGPDAFHPDLVGDSARWIRQWPMHFDPWSWANALPEYQPHMWMGQRNRVMVIAEKDGVIGIVRKACAGRRVAYASGRGDASITLKREVGAQFEDWRECGLDPVLLYTGDHDANGVAMDGKWIEDCGLLPGEFRRIAITLEQAEAHDFPTETVKGHHNAGQHAVRERYAIEHGLAKIELDAFQPSSLLEQVIADAIEEYVDAERWNERWEETAPERTVVENERAELVARLG